MSRWPASDASARVGVVDSSDACVLWRVGVVASSDACVLWACASSSIPRMRACCGRALRRLQSLVHGGRDYYYNKRLNRRQWEVPVAVSSAEAAATPTAALDTAAGSAAAGSAEAGAVGGGAAGGAAAGGDVGVNGIDGGGGQAAAQEAAVAQEGGGAVAGAVSVPAVSAAGEVFVFLDTQ